MTTSLLRPPQPSSAPSLSADDRRLARQLQAISNPIRLRILAALRQAVPGLAVDSLVERLSMPQSTVSRHLAWLFNAGFVGYREQGSHHCYFVQHEELAALFQQAVRYLLAQDEAHL